MSPSIRNAAYSREFLSQPKDATRNATPQMIYIGELTLAAAQGGPMDKLVTALEMMRTHGAFK